MKARAWAALVALGLVLAAAVWVRLQVGGELSALDESVRSAAMELRRERVLVGVIVGSSLAVAGVLLQSLLRNPLASPDLLGLSTGAGLAVAIAVYVGWRTTGLVGSTSGHVVPALVGSMSALVVVYVLSQRGGLVEPVSLVLVGFIVAIMLGAATRLVEHLLPDRGFELGRWLLGSLPDDVPRGHVVVTGLVACSGVVAGVGMSRAMDAAALGDDEARSVGVPLGGLQVAQFFLAGALTAGSVVLAGPIGFVGLVCPHVVRLMAGPAHGPVVAGSALAGAALIVGADALVKAIALPTGRLPLGVVTAFVGGPVFIVLLRRHLRQAT